LIENHLAERRLVNIKRPVDQMSQLGQQKKCVSKETVPKMPISDMPVGKMPTDKLPFVKLPIS
jgi:hypothetical protein